MTKKRELINYTLSACVLVIAVITWMQMQVESGERQSVPSLAGRADVEVDRGERIRDLETEVAFLKRELERVQRASSSAAEGDGIGDSIKIGEASESVSLDSLTARESSGWDPSLNQKWLRGDPREPPRLDPASIDPEAPEWFNPYTVEHLKRLETIAELHEIYELNRSEKERIVALNVLRMACLGEPGMDMEKAFPEELAADALHFMSRMEDTEGRWKVLANLSGLKYGVVRDEARVYLENDPDSDVRKRAAVALAPFRDDPDIRKILQFAAASDSSYEVRKYAEAALAGDRRYSAR